MLSIQRVHPHNLLRATQFKLCSLGKGKEELSVSAPGGFPFPILLHGQLLQGVFAHSLKHGKAVLSTGVRAPEGVATHFLPEQTLIEERLYQAGVASLRGLLAVRCRLVARSS